MEKIKFKVAVKINKPVAEVFRAFTDNTVISKYFVTESSAPIKAAGDKITWKWGEHSAEITVTEYHENKSVAFSWQGYKVEYDVHCRFEFEETGSATKVTVTEEGWKKDDEGIISSLANSEGWTDMLSSMKAWVMYGVDLRK